jgi:hypothetical protein
MREYDENEDAEEEKENKDEVYYGNEGERRQY